MVNFNDRLKEAMSMRHMTQGDLCKQTGIPKSAMSQYVSGAFKPKRERADIIADALNVSVAWLMGYTNVPTKSED